MMALLVMLSACQAPPEPVRPQPPEWKLIGRVANGRWPKMCRSFREHQVTAVLKPDYPDSEVWVKADEGYLYLRGLRGWKQSGVTGIWYDP